MEQSHLFTAVVADLRQAQDGHSLLPDRMRRKDREVTNIIKILQIIEKAKVLHLALFDADYMSSYLTGRGRIYFLAPPPLNRAYGSLYRSTAYIPTLTMVL